MTILPPELDANYEVLEELRAGGMGAVYRARHRHFDEPCVIKVMHAKLHGVHGARERFFSEARRGKQLRHPNIAEVLAFFVATDGRAYLVMEYVTGTNLRDLLVREGPLDPKLVVTIGVQSLAALSYLHARNIVHRDISPDNLMLTADAAGAPLVKLIDLGIAKSPDDAVSLTETGAFVGKVRYAAPEHFQQRVDARSDLYSLGVVLYELLTGAMPLRETEPLLVMAASLRGDPPRPFSETDPHGRVPEGLRAVVLKALEKDAAKRFQRADDFAEALRRSASGDVTTLVLADATAEGPAEPPQASPAPPAPPTQREPLFSRHPRLFAAAAALLVVLSTLAAVRRLRDPGGAPTAPPATVSAAAVPAATTLTVTAPDDAVTPERRKSAADAIARGQRLARDGRIDDAYAAFAAATTADPSNAFAWANFGGAAALMKRPDEARMAYERALSIDPRNWLAHYNLACQLTGAGDRDEALRHLEVSVAELKRQARSRAELESVFESIRADEALGDLRNDSRFMDLLAAD